MKHLINLTIILLSIFNINNSYSQTQVANTHGVNSIDLNLEVVKKEIHRLSSKHTALNFNKDYKRKNLLSGELIMVYQKIPGKKNTKNHILFRFDTEGKLISQIESLAFSSDEVINAFNLLPAKESIKKTKIQKSGSRTKQYSVFTIDPTQSSKSVFSYDASQLTRNNSKLFCPTIEALEAETHANENVSYDVELVGGNDAEQKKLAEIMCFHHLFSVDKYVKDQYLVYQALNQSAPPYPITAKVGFDPRGGTGGQTSFSIHPNSFDVFYPKRFNDKDFAEDGYMIRREYFRGYHNFLNGAEQGFDDGIDKGIADYIAYSSMKKETFNSPGNVMHNWANLETLNINFDNIHSATNPNSNSSQVLSTVFWFMHHFIFGEDRTTSIIFDVLPALNSGLNYQRQAAAEIYKTVVSIPNFATEQEKCLIASILLYVYGEDLRDELEAAGFYIQPMDIYIRDHSSDLTGEQPTINGSILNSPDIWNRQQQDGIYSHQMSFDDINQDGQEDYLYIRLNADICVQSFAQNFYNDLKVSAYYKMHKFGYNWEEDWNDNLPTQNVTGDLIGTFHFSDRENFNLPTYRDAAGQIHPINIIVDSDNEAITLEIPWNVPDIMTTLPQSLTHFRLNFGFLARIESAAIDPIEFFGSTEVEGTNASMNAKNFNNIAHKNSLLLSSIFAPWNDVDPLKPIPAVVLTPCIEPFCNPDPNDPDPTVTIHVIPAEHEPDPSTIPNHDGITPIRTVFNDYSDFGQVVVVLDDNTFSGWVQNGAHGSGFQVNSNNEIIAIDRNFKLEGIPSSRADEIKLVGLKFLENNNFERTAFDIIQEDKNGSPMGAMHVEVRKDEKIANRSQKQDISDIKFYPNPVNGDILNISNLTQNGTYTIHGLDGKLHVEDKFTKDQKALDISTLNKGIYFIQFRNETGFSESKKLIKI